MSTPFAQKLMDLRIMDHDLWHDKQCSIPKLDDTFPPKYDAVKKEIQELHAIICYYVLLDRLEKAAFICEILQSPLQFVGQSSTIDMGHLFSSADSLVEDDAKSVSGGEDVGVEIDPIDNQDPRKETKDKDEEKDREKAKEKEREKAKEKEKDKDKKPALGLNPQSQLTGPGTAKATQQSETPKSDKTTVPNPSISKPAEGSKSKDKAEVTKPGTKTKDKSQQVAGQTTTSQTKGTNKYFDEDI